MGEIEGKKIQKLNQSQTEKPRPWVGEVKGEVTAS